VLDVFADFDHVGEHVFNAIDSAIRSLRVGGWDSDDRSVSICWSEVTALPSMMRQAAGTIDSPASSQSGCRRDW
jgi:hypothetical protein